MNDKHYDFFNEYKDICTPSETLREYDVVFLSLEELPKLKSDIDGAHIIKWIDSAEKPDCMLAIVPKSGISERYNTFNKISVKNIKLSPVKLMIEFEKEKALKKLIGDEKEVKMHVYFIDGLVTAVREYRAIKKLEYC